MKRIICVIALLCIILTLAACSGGQSPAEAVESYCSGLGGSDGEFAEMLSEGEDYRQIIRLYPDIQIEFDIFIASYIKTFEYEIDDEKSVTDKKAGTAEVYVTLRYADMEQVRVLAAQEMLAWYGNLDHFPDTEETTAKSLDIMSDILSRGDYDKLSEEVVVKLTYNKETKEWDIDNKSDITEGFVA